MPFLKILDEFVFLFSVKTSWVIYQNDKNLRGPKLIVIHYLDETTTSF